MSGCAIRSSKLYCLCQRSLHLQAERCSLGDMVRCRLDAHTFDETASLCGGNGWLIIQSVTDRRGERIEASHRRHSAYVGHFCFAFSSISTSRRPCPNWDTRDEKTPPWLLARAGFSLFHIQARPE